MHALRRRRPYRAGKASAPTCLEVSEAPQSNTEQVAKDETRQGHVQGQGWRKADVKCGRGSSATQITDVLHILSARKS